MKLAFGTQVIFQLTTILVLAACELPSRLQGRPEGVTTSQINVIPLRPGMWGSSQATLSVSAEAAHLSLGCGSADIFGAMMLDPQNNFEADGTVTSAGGASPVGGFPSYAAHFQGHVNGDHLTLRVSSEAGQRDFEIELDYNFSGPDDMVRCQ